MSYAAITCLMRTIHQSMQLTGRDLQPFYEKLKSLRAILEKPWKATDDLEALTNLEAEIAEVAYSAEDMVDSKSRNVFFAQKAKNIQSRAFWELCCSLEQEVERIDSLMMQWLAIWNWYSKIKDLKARKFSLAASIPEHAVENPENIMVGHENEFEMMLNQVAGGERELEVVSIVATVSQEYCVRNVLLALLASTSEEPDDQLADQLQKLLKGKRYLVVIDDIWTTGDWDDIRQCFPDCNNRSQILLTTRNVEVAGYASSDSSAKTALILPLEILMMPQLRHLLLIWNYLHYHGITGKSLVLKKLHCLSGWNPRYCTGSFFRLFPNLKELQIRGFFEDFCSRKDLHDLRYLDQLEELEFHLGNPFSFDRKTVVLPLLLPPPCSFPQSLKNLAFTGNFFLPLKDLSFVGKLPKLKSLKLEDDAFIGDEWEVVEEGFPPLKFLLLKRLNTRHWRASSDHFPCLERLILDGCWNLDSIPQEFADITTLS
ncbi:hypothetical protein MTR67_053520 [Solanum verrucosum]|uniref:NB-ARC domain-containing protein n=1 Tax=Solanum verrucosum TaxID=315347 RepID=A0AAF0V8V4_SOLVR|nr:hypothetical protein MTR67_053520 [Solanum verrucosum]